MKFSQIPYSGGNVLSNTAQFRSYPAPITVLSLNLYMMGHITYQAALEQFFQQHAEQVTFKSVHLVDYFQGDLPGRLVHWLLRQRLLGIQADYDFFRFRNELANSFFARRCLERYCRSYQPKVLHIHTQSIGLLTAPLQRRLPSVVSVDYTSALLAREHPAPAAWTYRPIVALEQRCFRAAAHIITWSERARQSVIQDYAIAPSKVTTIAPPLPLQQFAALERPAPAPDHKPRLLFVGNDFIRKGGEDVLAVFLDQFSQTCELDLVTNAPLDLPTLPTLRLHRGLQPLSAALLTLYQQADIFVLPTYEDVYGIVFQEAMAAGLPCIGTQVMAVPELVRDGVNGLVVQPGDRPALAQALRRLIENPVLRQRMGKAGRTMAQERFDAIANCQQIARIFVDAASGNITPK